MFTFILKIKTYVIKDGNVLDKTKRKAIETLRTNSIRLVHSAILHKCSIQVHRLRSFLNACSVLTKTVCATYLYTFMQIATQPRMKNSC